MTLEHIKLPAVETNVNEQTSIMKRERERESLWMVWLLNSVHIHFLKKLESSSGFCHFLAVSVTCCQSKSIVYFSGGGTVAGALGAKTTATTAVS